LVWLDLEMTGLDVGRHRIVEIAVAVTDAQLELLDDGIDLVVHQPADALAQMDDFVRTMHTKSGLLPEIERSSLSLEAAGVQVLEYLARYVPPALDEYLHYRSIDVSSLKELCRRWYPAAYRKRPGKAEAHRALADVRESIAELRYYREAMLLPPETPAVTGPA
jgi:oligoribonuclease